MTNVDADTGVLAGEPRMLIDGELRYTDSGALFDVEHPASEQVVGQATDGTVTDVERATAAARRAFDESDWSRIWTSATTASTSYTKRSPKNRNGCGAS